MTGPDMIEAPRRVQALRRLWPYLRPYGVVLAGASLALVVAAGTVLALGAGLRLLVDQGFQSQDPILLDRALIVLLLVVAVLAVASYARFSLVSWLGERVVADLRKDVQAHLLRLSPAYFELNDAGALVSRLTADTTLVQAVVGTSVSFALRNALMFVGATVLLVITSPRLTGLVFLVLPVVVVPILVFGRRVRRLSRDSQDRLADVGTRLDEAVGAIKVVQAFNQEGAEARRFATAVEAAFAAAKRRIHARALLTASVMLLVFGAISTVLWLGGRDVIDGRISPGELSAFIFYAAVMAASIGTLSEVFGDLQRAAGAVERLLSVLDTEPEIKAPPLPMPLPEPSRGAIAFDGVRFAYPARPDLPIVDGLSLSVTPGETVALVGRSGAGKTTLFQLLLRFYDPGAGTVRLDGVDLRAADPAAVRDRIALVAQEPVLFSGSIGDNIRYGRPDADVAAVWRAAEAADAANFVSALPEGLDTQLGHRGIRLSGGQRQRLAIARALLRDPAVLLLDEPTSALDAESDRAVREALQHLMAGRSTLIIAHRLSTVRQADRIVVLDDRRIVAEGNHDTLMRGDGLYARLAALQFAEVADATAAQ